MSTSRRACESPVTITHEPLSSSDASSRDSRANTQADASEGGHDHARAFLPLEPSSPAPAASDHETRCRNGTQEDPEEAEADAARGEGRRGGWSLETRGFSLLRPSLSPSSLVCRSASLWDFVSRGAGEPRPCCSVGPLVPRGPGAGTET